MRVRACVHVCVRAAATAAPPLHAAARAPLAAHAVAAAVREFAEREAAAMAMSAPGVGSHAASVAAAAAAGDDAGALFDAGGLVRVLAECAVLDRFEA